ncbi:hypothetical protein ACFQLX_10870 [Streptomyces polyrhachis]|uniref:Secreted protein n=1 Tax=Streptomyces polyrhachis TaxID=1282885 RepID=A0ABW2GCY0_9ACTN
MTTDDPTPPAEETAPGAPADEVAPAGPRRRPLRRLLPAVATLVVLGVTGAGVAYTADRVGKADKTSPTAYWQGMADTKQQSPKEGAQHRSLGKLLLPMPTSYTPGPDIEQFGNDVELTGKQAVALMKQSAHGLPGPLRRSMNRILEKRKIEGQAMRSYSASVDDLVVEIQLTQMAKKAAKDSAAFQKELVGILDSLRRGPKVKGYKDAVCFLAPKDAWKEQDVMTCTAAKGSVLVSVTAYGPRTMDQKAVAGLLKDQLDRITDGESA